jgi:hypothetical protein
MQTIRAKNHAHLTLLFASIATTTGCVMPSDSVPGTISIELVGQTQSGSVYQLRNGTIHVTGPGYTRTWNTEDTPERTSLADEVAPGSYSALLDSGWRLERVLGASSVVIPAAVTSANPAAFTVTGGQVTTVTLRFRVDGEDLAMVGRYAIAIGVEEPSLRGELVVPNIDVSMAGISSVSVFSADSRGDAAAFRRVAGSSAALTTPEAAIVVDDQLIVCDSTRQAIVFFARTASGNLVPTKQIIGSSTLLNGPVDLAVAGSELYVLHRTGILVFPLGAIGNTSPSRTLTLTDRAGHHIAVANSQVYIAYRSASEATIRIYTTSLNFSRSITSSSSAFCPEGIAVSGGEIFVTDSCSPTVAVFPETTSGTIIPTRTIRGPNTEIGSPRAITLFQGELYMIDSDQTIRVFPANGNGDIFASRVLGGSHTGLTSAHNVFVR